MFVIAPTDIDWFYSLKSNKLNSNINFWTCSNWNVAKLNPGDRWYFMLKSPIKKIGGFGTFFQYKTLTIAEAWTEFSINNGCKDRKEFVKRIAQRDSRFSVKEAQKIDINSHVIGNAVLKDIVFWDELDFKNIENYALDYGYGMMFKYFYDEDPFIDEQQDGDSFTKVIEQLIDIHRNLSIPHPIYEKGTNFTLITDEVKTKTSQSNLTREGQEEFRKIVFKAYDGRCCISGENTSGVLEAAHIQPYINKDSNHIQNGLLLRVDLHKLFDTNLLFIDDAYIIHISSEVKSEYYQQFHLKRISLPTNSYQYPSIEALNTREFDFVP